MTIVGIATVKNEADIIEPFVRHNLQFISRLVILENGSTDETAKILQALVQEGLPLEVVTGDALGKQQSRQMTRLMREFAVQHHGADWVLPLDADEFLQVPPDTMPVENNADPHLPIALHWQIYVPAPEDDIAEVNPALRIHHRLIQGQKVIKVMVPRALASLPDAVLGQGSHDVTVAGQSVQPVVSDSVYLGHFPLRSAGQYLAKVAVSALQYQSMAGRPAEWGWHYRQLFALLTRDPSAIADSMYQAARRYLRAPGEQADIRTECAPFPYGGGPLRYTPTEDDAARGWRAVLRYAEQLADQYALLSASLADETRGPLEASAAVLAACRAEAHRQVRLRQHSEEEKERVIQEQHAALRGLQAELLRKEQVIQEQHAVLHGSQSERVRQEQLLQEQHAALQRCQQDIFRQQGELEEKERCIQRQHAELQRQGQLIEEQETQLRLSVQQREALTASWTWATGRFVLAPLRTVRAYRGPSPVVRY